MDNSNSNNNTIMTSIPESFPLKSINKDNNKFNINDKIPLISTLKRTNSISINAASTYSIIYDIPAALAASFLQFVFSMSYAV